MAIRRLKHAHTVTISMTKAASTPAKTKLGNRLLLSTIGSFPQTAEIRAARAAWNKGDLSDVDYETAMKA